MLNPAHRIEVLPYFELAYDTPAQGEAMAEQAFQAHIQLQQENIEHNAGITSEGQSQWSV